MVKNQIEIEKIKVSCKICKSILVKLGEMVRTGINTYELEEKAEELIRENNVVAAFKDYNGYPASLCVSVNEEVVHGIPLREKFLREGDIVSLDVGVIYKGYYSDCADTFPVGRLNAIHAKIIEVAHKSFSAGILKALPYNKVGDISAAIERVVEANNFSVVREFAGHGIGRELHEYPEVPNFGRSGWGDTLKEGIVLAIEPMINEGKADVRILSDGWTVVTEDGGYSAHYENCVLIGKNGPEILTTI
jgi:methionyl aminopeptidase